MTSDNKSDTIHLGSLKWSVNIFIVVVSTLSFHYICPYYPHFDIVDKKVWRYQKGNRNQSIEEQTTQWPKENVQKDKQRSKNTTQKTKDRAIRTPLKTRAERRCSGRVDNYFSTSGTRCVTLGMREEELGSGYDNWSISRRD